MTPPLLFLACSPADADICAELEKRLVPPRRQGLLRFASSRSLCWDRAAIRATIAEAHTVAFLLTNEYARSSEPGADGIVVSRAATVTIAAKLLDSAVASCWLPQGKADLPRNGHAISTWPDLDAALADVAEGLLEVLAPKPPSIEALAEADRCPTCRQALPKRETPASWAKLLHELAKGCTDPALRAQALGRAAELEALAASCACAARGGAPHAKGDPGCVYQPGTVAWGHDSRSPAHE